MKAVLKRGEEFKSQLLVNFPSLKSKPVDQLSDHPQPLDLHSFQSQPFISDVRQQPHQSQPSSGKKINGSDDVNQLDQSLNDSKGGHASDATKLDLPQPSDQVCDELQPLMKSDKPGKQRTLDTSPSGSTSLPLMKFDRSKSQPFIPEEREGNNGSPSQPSIEGLSERLKSSNQSQPDKTMLPAVVNEACVVAFPLATLTASSGARREGFFMSRQILINLMVRI